MPMRHLPIAFLLFLVPTLAWAERLPRPVEQVVDPLPVRVSEAPLEMTLLFEPTAVATEQRAGDGGEVQSLGGEAPAASTAKATEVSLGPTGQTRVGPGPWPLIGAPIDDSTCRAGRLSADGYTALAICRGSDAASPTADHVVIRQGDAVMRYPAPLAEVDDFDVDLSADGMRFAGSFQTGSGRAVHLVDLSRRTVFTLGGGWRDPGPPVLADAADAVAFVGRVGGKPTAVRVRLGETRADDQGTRLWVGGEPLAVRGISAEGRRVLITAKAVDLVEAILIEADRGARFDLSGRKGDVEHAALHGSGEQAVFSTRVGGACAVFWVDLSTRKRQDFLGSVDHCYGRVGVDGTRRYVAHEGVRGKGRRGFVWDRKKEEARLILPNGCSDPRLSDDGKFVAARCGAEAPGPGAWLFVVPEEESKR